MLVIDTAHGHSKNVLKTINMIKKSLKKLQYALATLQQQKLPKHYIILELIF